MKHIVSRTVVAFVLVAACGANAVQKYSWQEAQAEVTSTGDIKWTPKPFKFVKGDNVRYIDFENGSDENDGLTKVTPWKHHPWDLAATGNAQGAKGVVTYVFKRGVDYRGQLMLEEESGRWKNGKWKGRWRVAESGRAGDPIRLTSEPGWGNGEARILGSLRLPSKWVPAKQVSEELAFENVLSGEVEAGGPEPDVLNRIPEIDKVWALDLNKLGVLGKNRDIEIEITPSRNPWAVQAVEPLRIGMFRVDPDGTSHVQHLAQTPDWQPHSDSFAFDYWHQMDGQQPLEFDDGKVLNGMQADFLKGHPQDWFTGGYIHPQIPAFGGAPYPRVIARNARKSPHAKQRTSKPMYDPVTGTIYTQAFQNNWAKGARYMINNLPQYLDAPEEFYYDKDSGFLFYRPPEGSNPNTLHLEWSRFSLGIRIASQSHIDISGLGFRYQNGAGVKMHNDVSDITIRNCTFEKMVVGVSLGMSNWRTDKDKKTGKINPRHADRISVLDCRFRDTWTSSISMSSAPTKERVLGHVEVLRNSIFNNGVARLTHYAASQPGIYVSFPRTAEIAGNIVERSWGTGIQVFGGFGEVTTWGDVRDQRLSRILVHHNKTAYTCLAINDYGGMSLWQGGPIYCFNNNIGQSTGHMPGGWARWKTPPWNLSYPLYLDGAYKVYSFNNIIWSRSNDRSIDKYASHTPGYLMVFGFLNQFVNNTMYRTGEGVGGSAGQRNDVVGNLFSDLRGEFIANDRYEDPSLVGGGDDGSSGRRGVPTLAYANNVFYGDGKAGKVLRVNEKTGIDKGIEGETIEELSQSMCDYPVRYGKLGWRAEKNPIIGAASSEPLKDISEVDFRPSAESLAVDHGASYFVPWGLSRVVGEWHFTVNQADPDRATDYAWYQSMAHYHRMMYEFVPPLDLIFTEEITPDTHTAAPCEDWCKGAVVFDGKRFASVSDQAMRKDIEIPINRLKAMPKEGWILPEKKDGGGYVKGAVVRFPGKSRHTLIADKDNVLVEAIIRVATDCGESGILGKYDGKTGYRLVLNSAGQPELQVAGREGKYAVAAQEGLKDGKWHHILAELDRESGRMTIYVDGKKSAETKCSLPADSSLDNQADFLVGKTHDGKFFKGAMDFMRVCKATLADAETDIAELYEWQTNGPFKYDMRGNAPRGKRRDAGALERVAM